MGAAVALAPSAFAASPGLAALTVGATAVSAGLGIASGLQARSAARDQARSERLRQQQATLQGVQRSNQILQDQVDAIAAVNVSSAAAGMDPFSGTPRRVKDRIRARANRQLNTAAVDTQFQLAASRSASRQARNRGTAGLITGFGEGVNAISSGASTLRSIG